MKITHVIIGLGIGGAELMLKRLVEGLNGQDGMQHSVISLTEIGPVGQQLLDSGINVTSLGMKNALSILSIFIKLRRELKKQSPDIVQTWMYHADFLGGLAAKSLGIDNVIWNVRNTYLDSSGKFNAFFRKICAYLSHNVPKKIIYVSQSAHSEHLKQKYRPGIGTVIGNGFDTEKYSFSPGYREKYRAELKLKDSDFAVFSVGRYDPAKDHASFIAAVCLAAKTNPEIKGVLVGRDIRLNSFGLSEIEKKNFIVTGQRGDVAELLSAADMFCLHSVTEGFPNVLGEAMSIGLPCITTDAGDAALILKDKDYIVDVGDYRKLSNKINELASQTYCYRRAIGIKNRENIKTNHSLGSVLNKYSNFYLSLECNE